MERMSMQHPERLDKYAELLNIGVRVIDPKLKPFIKAFKRKIWEEKKEEEKKEKERKEEKTGASITKVPVVASLPATASDGDLVYCEGLYVYSKGWQRIDKPLSPTSVVFGAIKAIAVTIEPEAVYATKTGDGDVYVAVNEQHLRSLVFEAQTPPANDASAKFAMSSGIETTETYKLMFSVTSNQPNKTLRFAVDLDNTYDFPVATDAFGAGSVVLDIRGSTVVKVTRRYTYESGLVYPCWTSCALMLFK
jgi:hypothetical protein